MSRGPPPAAAHSRHSASSAPWPSGHASPRARRAAAAASAPSQPRSDGDGSAARPQSCNSARARRALLGHAVAFPAMACQPGRPSSPVIAAIVAAASRSHASSGSAAASNSRTASAGLRAQSHPCAMCQRSDARATATTVIASVAVAPGLIPRGRSASRRSMAHSPSAVTAGSFPAVTTPNSASRPSNDPTSSVRKPRLRADMPPRTCTCISPRPRSSAIAWAASMTSRDDRRMPALRDLSSARARTSRPRLSSAAPPVISPQTARSASSQRPPLSPSPGHPSSSGLAAARSPMISRTPMARATVHGRCRPGMSAADRNRSGSRIPMVAQAPGTAGLRSTPTLVSASPSGPTQRASATARRMIAHSPASFAVSSAVSTTARYWHRGHSLRRFNPFKRGTPVLPGPEGYRAVAGAGPMDLPLCPPQLATPRTGGSTGRNRAAGTRPALYQLVYTNS